MESDFHGCSAKPLLLLEAYFLCILGEISTAKVLADLQKYFCTNSVLRKRWFFSFDDRPIANGCISRTLLSQSA